MTIRKHEKYFMNDPREANRLALKVNPDDFIEKYLSSFVKDSSKVLDVGCGSGVITTALGKKFPNAIITGIDLNEDRFKKENSSLDSNSNVNFIVGNARKLPFNNEYFDIVFIRFLLEYLKNPVEIIKEMLRVLKYGGVIVLQDLDGQLCTHYPENNLLQTRLFKIIKYLEKDGFDPFIGRKLFSFLRSEKVTNISIEVNPYHLFAGSIDDHNLAIWDLKLDIALPEIAKALESEESAITFKNDYLEFLKDAETLTFSNVFTVTGIKH